MLNNENFSNESALLRRAEIFLEDNDWNSASNYFNNVLDMNPENAKAYIGLLLVDLKITKESGLEQSLEAFDQNNNYLKAIRFADPEYKMFLSNIAIKNAFFRAQKLMNSSNINDLNNAIQLFQENGSEEANRNIEICKSNISSIEKKNKKQKRNNTIAIITIISTILISVLVVLTCMISANNKKATEIYNNFLGKSFSGSTKDDDGFAWAYLHGNLDQYRTYWETVEKKTLKFNDDGTVYFTSLTDMKVLAYPRVISEPRGIHNEYDGTLSSFSVSVTLNGTVYVKMGYHKCKVYVDSNNVPQAIYNYDGMTLN